MDYISVIIFVPHNRNPLSIPFHKPEIIYKAGDRFLKNIYLSYTLQISSYICPFFIWGALQILETHNFLWSKLYFQIDSDFVNVKRNIRIHELRGCTTLWSAIPVLGIVVFYLNGFQRRLTNNSIAAYLKSSIFGINKLD